VLLRRSVVSLGSGAWRDDGFFRGLHGFPSALRHSSCPIGSWGAGGLARERRGSVRAITEEAEGGSTSGGGIAEPLRQV
jgi:hypothetical protein